MDTSQVVFARKLLFELGGACLVTGLVAAQYSGDTGKAMWISGTLFAMVLFLPYSIRMRWVDWSVLLLGTLEIPFLLSSTYRANSIHGFVVYCIFALTYFATRMTIHTTLQATVLSGVLGLASSYLAVYAIIQFDQHQKALNMVGLLNLVAFRSRLISPPSPWIPGEWFTLLLLGLPFACAVPVYLLQKQRKTLAATALGVPLLVAVVLCLSMSRAVFWSVVLFCVLVCTLLAGYRLCTRRAIGVLLGAWIGGLVLTLVVESVLYPGLMRAYTGQHTSQIRSTQGRYEIWNRSLALVMTHPLLGVGSGNAALVLSSTADQEDTSGFASRTFSLPIQVLVEKGIVGFLAYCTFLLLVVCEFIRTMRYSPPDAVAMPSRGPKKARTDISANRNGLLLTDLPVRKAMACCFAAGLVAVLFRELTYSSLFEHSLTLALAGALAALVCLPEAGQV